MRAHSRFIALLEVFAVFVLAQIGSAAASGADEPLRWKFEVGQKINYSMAQDISVSMGDQVAVKMHQDSDVTWTVEGVDASSGEAVITQKFDRVKLQGKLPNGELDFDSKSDKPATGLEASIAPVYKAVTDGAFELTMTSRGEIDESKVKIPGDVVTVLKSSPGATALGGNATEEGLKKMIAKCAFVLPQGVPKVGETTKTSVVMDNQAKDKQVIETSYIYQGTKDIDGTTYAVFKPQLTMAYADADRAGKPSIGDQHSDGEVLFDPVKGQLKSLKLEEHVTINTASANQPVQERFDQKVDIDFSPSSEKKEDGIKPADASEQKAAKN